MKTIVLFRRRPDLTRAAFRDYYETRHVPLAVRHVRLSKYVRNHVVAPADAAFDAMSEFWLADPNAAAALATSPAGVALREDESRFMIEDRFRAVAEEELVAGAPRTVETGIVRKYALMMTRPTNVTRPEFLDLIRNWGLMLFAGGALARVTLDSLESFAGGSFPADAIVSVWPNALFSDSTLGAQAGAGLLALEASETAGDQLIAAHRA